MIEDRRRVVCSFWVHRPKEYPKAAPYLDMLRILDASCRRFGFEHVVLTDSETSPAVSDAGMTPFMVELPQPLMQATTQVQARWLESPHSKGVDSIFVGADCLIRRDFRQSLPTGDLAIAFMKGHKRWRLNNGFMCVPAESRERVAPVFRLIADDTGPEMFEDMLAIERALVPMPPDYGLVERRGLRVNFLPLPTWNRYMAVTKETPNPVEDTADDANVLHFMGGWENGKALFFNWAKAHGFS